MEVTVDKMRTPVARILTWPWLTSSLHTCGDYMAVDSIKRAPPIALGMTRWRCCKAAGEQRTEAQRTAVQDDCAEARRTAVQTEGPRSRDGLPACRLTRSE